MKCQKLELVEVAYDESGKKATLTFLDELEGIVREVQLQTQGYDESKKKFIDDPEKEEKVKGYVKDVFGTEFDEINSKVGNEYDVYIYDNFNHIVEFNIPNKFDPEDVGQIFPCTIVDVIDNQSMNKIEITVEVDEEHYLVNMPYSKRLNINGEPKYFKDPDKLERQKKTFEKKFGVPFEQRSEIIGEQTFVEVKKFGDNTYGDIKALKKSK